MACSGVGGAGSPRGHEDELDEAHFLDRFEERRGLKVKADVEVVAAEAEEVAAGFDVEEEEKRMPPRRLAAASGLHHLGRETEGRGGRRGGEAVFAGGASGDGERGRVAK